MTRFLFLLGLYPVQRFLLYYLEDRFDIDDPFTGAAWAILLAIVAGAIAAAVVGWVSNDANRNTLSRIAIVVGAVGVLGVGVLPVLWMVAVAGLAVAIGAGAFQALNWAALTRAVPDGEGARFLGVANIATAGASAVAGIMGPLVDLGQRFIPAASYPLTFSLAALFTLSALATQRAGGGAATRGGGEGCEGARADGHSRCGW